MSGARDTLESPTAPPALRLLLIALLPLMAALLYLDGQTYQPDLLQFEPGAAAPDHSDLFPDRLGGLERAGPVRRYDEDTLYEYINGHAEYFIGAGFAGLSVGEYGAGADDQPSLVVNLYDMGNALNAFGVLVNEAGSGAPVDDVGALAFAAGSGVNFIQGPYYAQLNLFGARAEPLAAARELAARLARDSAGGELAFRFPDFGEVLATRFVREYYRGMEFFNRVLERDYRRDGEIFQAFVIPADEREVRDTARALTAFLDEDGIAYSRSEANGLTFTQVRDPYEGDWFFVPLKSRLIGVYAPLKHDLIEAVGEFAGDVSTP